MHVSRPRYLHVHLRAISRMSGLWHVRPSAFHVGQPLVVQVLFRRVHEKSTCVPGHVVKAPCKSSMEARFIESGLHRLVGRSFLVTRKAVTGTQADFSCSPVIFFCRRLCDGSASLLQRPATHVLRRPCGSRAASYGSSHNARFVLVVLTLSRKFGASSARSRYSSQSSYACISSSYPGISSEGSPLPGVRQSSSA